MSGAPSPGPPVSSRPTSGRQGMRSVPPRSSLGALTPFSAFCPQNAWTPTACGARGAGLSEHTLLGALLWSGLEAPPEALKGPWVQLAVRTAPQQCSPRVHPPWRPAEAWVPVNESLLLLPQPTTLHSGSTHHGPGHSASVTSLNLHCILFFC